MAERIVVTGARPGPKQHRYRLEYQYKWDRDHEWHEYGETFRTIRAAKKAAWSRDIYRIIDTKEGKTPVESTLIAQIKGMFKLKEKDNG